MEKLQKSDFEKKKHSTELSTVHPTYYQHIT